MPSINHEIENARTLKGNGNYAEAIALLKPIVEETDDLETRVISANELVNCILETLTAPGPPAYGTPEYTDIAKYLRLAVTSYKQLTSSQKLNVGDEPSSLLLKQISKADPNIQNIENALKSMEGQFKPGRVTVARRSEWSEDFLARFPHKKTHSFSNNNPNIISVARQLASKTGLLILMNTDGHENEILCDTRYG